MCDSVLCITVLQKSLTTQSSNASSQSMTIRVIQMWPELWALLVFVLKITPNSQLQLITIIAGSLSQDYRNTNKLLVVRLTSMSKQAGCHYDVILNLKMVYLWWKGALDEFSPSGAAAAGLNDAQPNSLWPVWAAASLMPMIVQYIVSIITFLLCTRTITEHMKHNFNLPQFTSVCQICFSVSFLWEQTTSFNLDTVSHGA